MCLQSHRGSLSTGWAGLTTRAVEQGEGAFFGQGKQLLAHTYTHTHNDLVFDALPCAWKTHCGPAGCTTVKASDKSPVHLSGDPKRF